MKRMNFTKDAIRKLLASHNGKRQSVYDTRQPGLIIDVRATGAASYYLYRRIDGRPTRYRLGAVEDLTPEQARRQAASLTGDIAKGGDPVAERRKARVEHTLGALFDWWREIHGEPRLKPSSLAEYDRLFAKHLAHWRTRKLSQISRAEVQSLHAKIGRDNGKYLANRVLAVLKLLFNKADAIGYRGANPAAKVERFREQSRDRFLQTDEVPRFIAALEYEPAIFQDFFWLLLLTGARRSNVQSMRWQDLDLQLRMWRVPGEQSKNGLQLVITLPERAVEILLLRFADKTDSPYVFASYGKHGYLQEPKGAWKRIVERAGLKDIRPHDLRRTLGSWLAIQGVSLPVIGAALGHKSLQSTAVYARLTRQPVIDAVTKATTALIDAAGKGGHRNGKTK